MARSRTVGAAQENRIMALFRNCESGLTQPDISERLGMPKSLTIHYLQCLVASGRLIRQRTEVMFSGRGLTTGYLYETEKGPYEGERTPAPYPSIRMDTTLEHYDSSLSAFRNLCMETRK